MRQYLYWWNKLAKPEKQSIMQKHNIKSITYSDIKVIYNENKLNKKY